MPLQCRDEASVDLNRPRHLFRVAEDQALELREERARLRLRERVELLLRHARPLPEGGVVDDSVPATIQLRDAHVGDLTQAEIEVAVTQHRVPGEKRCDRARVVSHELHLRRNVVALEVR